VVVGCGGTAKESANFCSESVCFPEIMCNVCEYEERERGKNKREKRKI
jgi:hypothetical protein